MIMHACMSIDQFSFFCPGTQKERAYFDWAVRHSDGMGGWGTWTLWVWKAWSTLKSLKKRKPCQRCEARFGRFCWFSIYTKTVKQISDIILFSRCREAMLQHFQLRRAFGIFRIFRLKPTPSRLWGEVWRPLARELGLRWWEAWNFESSGHPRLLRQISRWELSQVCRSLGQAYPAILSCLVRRWARWRWRKWTWGTSGWAMLVLKETSFDAMDKQNNLKWDVRPNPRCWSGLTSMCPRRSCFRTFPHTYLCSSFLYWCGRTKTIRVSSRILSASTGSLDQNGSRLKKKWKRTRKLVTTVARLEQRMTHPVY